MHISWARVLVLRKENANAKKEQTNSLAEYKYYQAKILEEGIIVYS